MYWVSLRPFSFFFVSNDFCFRMSDDFSQIVLQEFLFQMVSLCFTGIVLLFLSCAVRCWNLLTFSFIFFSSSVFVRRKQPKKSNSETFTLFLFLPSFLSPSLLSLSPLTPFLVSPYPLSFLPAHNQSQIPPPPPPGMNGYYSARLIESPKVSVWINSKISM